MAALLGSVTIGEMAASVAAKETAVSVLPGVGVAVCLISCLGLFVLRDEWTRLHALGPPSTVGVLCFFGAGIAQEIGSPLQGAVKPALLILFYGLASPLMIHAIAQALHRSRA